MSLDLKARRNQRLYINRKLGKATDRSRTKPMCWWVLLNEKGRFKLNRWVGIDGCFFLRVSNPSGLTWSGPICLFSSHWLYTSTYIADCISVLNYLFVKNSSRARTSIMTYIELKNIYVCVCIYLHIDFFEFID